MSGATDNGSEISEDWLVRNVPLISFFCENDEFYTMHFLQAVDGKAFGYKLSSFIDNKAYAAIFTTHPDDLDIVDQHAEQAVQGGSPVVSRYRLIDSDGEHVPVLLVSHAVMGEGGSPVGLGGVVVDLRNLPALRGESAVLSECRVPEKRRPSAKVNSDYTAAWVLSQLPVLTFYAENDESYTVRGMYGSLEEMSGYTPQQFLKNGQYKPSSTVLPEDQDIADTYIEQAARQVGSESVARFRLVHSNGHAIPVIIFARGTRLEGAPRNGIAGVVLDISHVPALQGEFEVLTTGGDD